MTTTSSTIYVGNLPSQLDQSMLAAHFAPFGEIVALSLPSTGSRNKGFAFISFSSPDNALDALDNMNLNSIAGRTIHINLANPNKLNTTPNHNKPIWHSEVRSPPPFCPSPRSET